MGRPGDDGQPLEAPAPRRLGVRSVVSILLAIALPVGGVIGGILLTKRLTDPRPQVAEAVRAFAQPRNVHAVMTYGSSGRTYYETEMWVTSDGRTRSESRTPGASAATSVNVADAAGRTAYTPATNVVTHSGPAAKPEERTGRGGWLEWLRAPLPEDAEVLAGGTSERAGRKVRAFRVRFGRVSNTPGVGGPPTTAGIWIDRKTSLPMAVREQFGTEERPSMTIEWRLDYPTDLSDDLFRLAIPEGAWVIDVDAAKEALAEPLGAVAEARGETTMVHGLMMNQDRLLFVCTRTTPAGGQAGAGTGGLSQIERVVPDVGPRYASTGSAVGTQGYTWSILAPLQKAAPGAPFPEKARIEFDGGVSTEWLPITVLRDRYIPELLAASGIYSESAVRASRFERRAEVLIHRGYYEEAIPALREAIAHEESGSGRDRLRLDLARACVETGRIEEAVKLCRQMIAEGTSNASVEPYLRSLEERAAHDR